MDRIWLASYPPGVPADIDADAFPSLAAMFEASCARFRDRPACSSLGVTLSYGELERLAQAFGRALRGRLGMVEGERLAVLMPNSLQVPVVVFGALGVGVGVVNCNPLYTPRELAFQLKDSGATTVVALQDFAHTLEEALPGTAVRHVVLTEIGDLFPAWRRVAVNFAVRHRRNAPPAASIADAVHLRDLLEEGAELPAPDVRVAPTDVAFVQYTGGTTGMPKGALLTHRNMVANVEQTVAWLGGTLTPGEEVMITALPLYHVFALLGNLLVFTRLGGENVLVPDPRDMHSFVHLLANVPFTAITGVNTLFDALLAAPGFDAVVRARRGRVKLAVAGGMPVNRRVADDWERALGTPLVEGYGLSEASPIVCANPVGGASFTGKLGLPVPSTEIAIVDQSGAELPHGEVGEIRVRGPQVMKGYLNQPEQTARVLSPDGWLRTGDLGTMDDAGWVTFVDRSKDVIVVSGFKAFPAEIEEVVKQMPGVRDAGVVGVPDERTGQAVALFIVASDATLTADAVRAHCERSLAAYKRPRHIEMRPSLPLSSVGKVLRRELRLEGAGAPAPAKG